MSHIAIGQAGGPTAVINSSLVGFLDHIGEKRRVFGVMNGYQGLTEDDLIPLEGPMREWVKKNRYVPGACLGSGRYPFAEKEIYQSVINLKKRNISTLVFIGGNGTMAALKKLSEAAKEINYDLQVIGMPKTVDNDLTGTDHAPGFGSAARYVALSMRDISKDLEAMKNFEQVRIIETMGRNAGWLAAASGYLRGDDQDGPHLVCIPEVPIEPDRFIRQVRETVKEYGFATIAVSEGAFLEGALRVEKAIVQGRQVLGGVSKALEGLIQEELGLTARAELLGMNQRSSFIGVSLQDRMEAYDVGKKAAQLVGEQQTDVMVSIQRKTQSGYGIVLNTCDLEKAANGGERLLPAEFITNTAVYYNWLKPIVGDDIFPYPPALRRNTQEGNYCRLG